MRYDGSANNYWVPEDSVALVASGANNQYVVGKNKMIRIAVHTAAVYMKFGASGMAIAGVTNTMLPVGVHFVNSGTYDFMSISTPANANVIRLKHNQYA
jgi:hypothetical protein